MKIPQVKYVLYVRMWNYRALFKEHPNNIDEQLQKDSHKQAFENCVTTVCAVHDFPLWRYLFVTENDQSALKRSLLGPFFLSGNHTINLTTGDVTIFL